jgi:hypothetical protein
LDESASASELLAALEERGRKIAALESENSALSTQVAEIPALKADNSALEAHVAQIPGLLAQMQGLRLRGWSLAERTQHPMRPGWSCVGCPDCVRDREVGGGFYRGMHWRSGVGRVSPWTGEMICYQQFHDHLQLLQERLSWPWYEGEHERTHATTRA